MSADNQQERLRTEGWIVGLVDGEGCFSISIIKNKTTKTGWQVFPELVVTQGAKSSTALNQLRNFFGCGKIFVNQRYDNHKENLYRFCVRRLDDLEAKIIPFFTEHRLKTAKRESFKKFVEAIRLIKAKRHLSLEGLSEIARLAESINRQKVPRFLESSETVR